MKRLAISALVCLVPLSASAAVLSPGYVMCDSLDSYAQVSKAVAMHDDNALNYIAQHNLCISTVADAGRPVTVLQQSGAHSRIRVYPTVGSPYERWTSSQAVVD